MKIDRWENRDGTPHAQLRVRAVKEFSPMVEESKIECKFRAFCAHAIVVGWDRKLAAQVADGIIIKRDSQFQFNGHPSLTVTEIPDTFTQNGIHHRSNLILRAPYEIVVSHSIQYSVPR